MAIPLVINGQVFEYPQNFDTEWGIDATGWAQAVTNGMLSLAGGNFPLTVQVNFGPNFGLTALNLITETAAPASTGFIRLAKTDAVEWRNNANNANLALSIDGSDNLNFNGVPLGTTALAYNDIYVGNASNVPVAVAMSGDATIVASGALTIASGAVNNAKVASGAAIAVNKLAALTPNTAIASDSSGFLVSSATTDTELGYVSGVTSSIQTQINNVQQVPSGAMLDFAGTVAPTGWLLCDGSSYATATYPTLAAAIGYTWGGSGANFNVPNMTRCVSMGSGGASTGVIGNTVGSIGGAESITFTTIQNAHTHTENSHYHNLLDGVSENLNIGTLLGVYKYGGILSTTGNSGGTPTPRAQFATGAQSDAGMSSTTATNTATAISVIQSSAVVLKIIKI